MFNRTSAYAAHVARLLLGTLALAVTAAGAQTEPNEEDFFEPVPVVLTVSRLAQSLHDTPGAVTVLDRETIRRSGARDLADVMRLVPGYIVSGYNGVHQIGVYHAVLDEYGTRNLVLVNGRTLYSSTYLGGTMRGVSSIPLDDVERIEVLRGSNSAAYGANAMNGVVNIITRHTADTLGQEVSLSLGDGGVADAHARIGWGGPEGGGSHRLSVSRLADDGYGGIRDSRQVHRLNWQSDFRLGGGDELSLEAGATHLRGGEGLKASAGNPERDIRWTNQYAMLRWQRDWSSTESTKLLMSIDRDRTEDHFYFSLGGDYLGSLVDAGATEQRWNIEFQHQRSESDTFRWLLGAGLKEDRAWSIPLFGPNVQPRIKDARIFGSVEWRFKPNWLMNVSLFSGHNSETGAFANPRLFFNYQIDSHQSLRFGFSEGQRNPSLFENLGNRRVKATNIGKDDAILFVGSGMLLPETLRTVELGYLLHSPQNGVSLDVRAFKEFLREYIAEPIPPESPPSSVNKSDGIDVAGIEGQLRWNLSPEASIWINQTFLNPVWRTTGVTERNPPTSMTSVAWFQRLSPEWDLTLQVHARNRMNWRSAPVHTLEPTVRADVRVARHWKTSSHRGELALNIQALGGDQTEFASRSTFERRAFATLRLEY